MDFYAMKRKQLQSLCKVHGIPANLTNAEMADRLTLILKKDGKPIEPGGKNLEENEREIESEIETKKVKKVKFSPENQTFYFVATDNDSDTDCDYNPKKKKGGKRKSLAVKQVSENKKVQGFENPRGFELPVEIFVSSGRVTRSRAQNEVQGHAEAAFSPLSKKKEVPIFEKAGELELPVENIDSPGRVTRYRAQKMVQGDVEAVLSSLPKKKVQVEKSKELEFPVEIIDSLSRVTRNRAKKMVQGDVEAVFSPLPEKKKLQFFERSKELELPVEIIEPPGRVTRYRAQKMVQGDVEAVFSPLPEKKVQVFEKSKELELPVEIIDPPGRFTRSRAKNMVKGDTEAVFSAVPEKKKVRAGVQKVDDGDKPHQGVELSERDVGNVENSKLSGGLIQIQLRSRLVLSEDGGNSLRLRKDQVPRGSKKTKKNKGSEGVHLPIETYKDNVPIGKGILPEKVQRQRKEKTKVDDSSVLSEKPRKVDLGGRITRSQTQVEGKSSGSKSKRGTLKVQEEAEEVFQLEETSKGLDRKDLRRKSAAPMKGTVEGENLADEAIEPVKTIRRSKRNLPQDIDSLCVQLTETKAIARRKKLKTQFMGKASIQEKTEEVPQLEESSKGQSISSSRPKFPVIQNRKELEKGDNRKRPRNTVLKRVSEVPLRKSRRKTTLFSYDAPDNRELKIHKAAGTVKQSKSSGQEKSKEVPQLEEPSEGRRMKSTLKFSAVQKGKEQSEDDTRKRPRNADSERASKKNVETVEESVVLLPHSPARRSRRLSALFSSVASEDKELRIREATGTVKQSLESVVEKGSNVTESLRRSSRNVCMKIALEATDDMDEISNAVKKDGLVKPIQEPTLEKQSSYIVEAAKSDLVAPSGLTVIAAEKNKKSESRISILAEEVLFAKINSPLEEKPNPDVGLYVLETAGNENNIGCFSSKEAVENSSKKSELLSSGDSVGDVHGHSCPSLNSGDNGHDSTIAQNPVECPDKLSHVVFSRSTCIGDGQSPTYQPDCEEGLESEESSVKMTNQRSDVLDDQLADSSKANVPENQDFVQLDASGIDQLALVDPVLEDHLTEPVGNKESGRNAEKSAEVVEEISNFSSCDRIEIIEVARSCQSLNRGDTGHGESSKLLDLKEGLERDESLTIKAPNQETDMVDDQLEDSSKASVPEDQNMVQFIAHRTGQPVLLEPALEDNLTEFVEYEGSDRNAEKFSEEISAFSPCDREEIVEVDLGSEKIAEPIAESVGAIHPSRIVPSDTVVTPSRSLVVMKDGNQFKFQSTIVGKSTQSGIGLLESSSAIEVPDEATSFSKGEILCGHQRTEGAMQEENESFKELDICQTVIEEVVSEGCGRKLDDCVLNRKDLKEDEKPIAEVVPVCKSLEENEKLISKVEPGRKESIRDGAMDKENESFTELDICQTVIAEVVSEACERKLGDGVLNKTDLQEDGKPIAKVEPVCKSFKENENLVSKVERVRKESDRNSEISSDVVEKLSTLCPSDSKEMVQVNVGSRSTTETNAETTGEIHQGGIVPSYTAVTPSKSSLVKQDENQFEARAIIVGEIYKNRVGMKESYGSKVPDEATTSWNAEILCGHERTKVVDPEESESCKTLDIEKTVIKDVVRESFERNSNLDDGVLTKTDMQEDAKSITKVKPVCTESDRYSEKSSEVIEDLSAETIGGVHKGGIVPSGTAVTQSNPSLVEQDATQFEEVVGEDFERNSKLDDGVLGKTDMQEDEIPITEVEPACKSLEENEKPRVEVEPFCKESDGNTGKSFDVVEETLCPSDRKEMNPVGVESIKTGEISGEIIEEIYQGGIVPSDTFVSPLKPSLLMQDNQALDLHVESEISTHWEMKSIFGNAEQDVAGKPDEPNEGYLKNKNWENEVDGADNTKIIEQCVQRFSERELGDHDHNAGIVQEPTLKDNERCTEQDNASVIIQEYIDCEKGMEENFGVQDSNAFTHKDSRIGDSGYNGLDEQRNCGVTKDIACSIIGGRMEIQRPEHGCSLLSFSSAGSKMAFPEKMPDFSKIIVPALGACIEVAKEVSETLLQADEVNFGGVGKCKDTSLKLDKSASTAPSDSISMDDETTERIGYVRKMDEESSSKDTRFDAQEECNLDTIPGDMSNNISDQLAEKKYPAGDDDSFDNSPFGYGHRNNDIGSDKVGTTSMEAITGIEDIDDDSKLVEETKARSDGGNISEERYFSDANLFPGISSSRAYLEPLDLSLLKQNVSLPCNDKRRDLPMQGENVGGVERVSGTKNDDGLNSGTEAFCNELGSNLKERDLRGREDNVFEVPERVSGVKVGEGLNAALDGFGEENCTRTLQETEKVHNLRSVNGIKIPSGDTKESTDTEMIEADEVSEDIKEGRETALDIPMYISEQRSDDGQRMVEEVLKSSLPPVSDENTCVNEGPKEKGIDDESVEDARFSVESYSVSELSVREDECPTSANSGLT